MVVMYSGDFSREITESVKEALKRTQPVERGGGAPAEKGERKP